MSIVSFFLGVFCGTVFGVFIVTLLIGSRDRGPRR